MLLKGGNVVSAARGVFALSDLDGLVVFMGLFPAPKCSNEDLGAIPADACPLAEVRGLVE